MDVCLVKKLALCIHMCCTSSLPLSVQTVPAYHHEGSNFWHVLCGLWMLQDLLHATGLKVTEHSCESLLCPIPSTNHQRALLHSQTPQLVLEVAVTEYLQCRGGGVCEL